jgi:regulator of replication initiation timing
MADIDFSKTAVYESLSAINQATDQLTEHIERLKSAYRLKFKMADLFRLTAEELRAQINQSVIVHMSRDEVTDAARFQKLRTERAKEIVGE